MHKYVTLKQVAKQAGVSVTTVSNVVRGWPYISEAIRSKVQTTIDELGYTPNPIAQRLRTGKTQTIGFMVPDLSSAYFAAMISAAEAVARDFSYSIQVYNTNEMVTLEATHLTHTVNGSIDGLLIVPTFHPTKTYDALTRLGKKPVTVMLDRVLTNTSTPYCRVDNQKITNLALNHLYKLGHHRIAHLRGPKYALPANARSESYKAFIKEKNLDYCIESTASQGWNGHDGYHAMLQILRRNEIPSAVFSSNDAMAIGAMSAAHTYGLKIPQDISILGVDNVEVGQFVMPPLTTVRQPLDEMAECSLKMLIELMNGNVPAEQHVTLEPDLIVRESTESPGNLL